MYSTHALKKNSIGKPSSYHDRLRSELKPAFVKLYRYHIMLKNIVEKIREKNIGKMGQLTDDEKEFLKPVFESLGLHDFYQGRED